ncbi:AraC family transcriptional regulator, partial [Coprobacillus cateniformis]|nr:AraC family transcriptional regulator [Coprobacillus cateniformis]
ILDYTHEFFTLENHYFADIIEDPSCIESYPIYTHFLHNEFYFFFHYPLADIKYICIGPYFSLKFTPQDHPSDFPFLEHVISSYTLNDFTHLPYAHHDMTPNIRFVYQIITGKSIVNEDLKSNYREPKTNPLKQENTMEQEIFQIRETPLHEFSYSYEQKIINYI